MKMEVINLRTVRSLGYNSFSHASSPSCGASGGILDIKDLDRILS